MVPETPSLSFESQVEAAAAMDNSSSGGLTGNGNDNDQLAGVSLKDIENYAKQREQNNRRDSSASTFSDWFNTTRDEMILYEKFGENYDEIVAKMSHSEKVRESIICRVSS